MATKIQDIRVIRAPRDPEMGFFAAVFTGFRSLLTGMGVTFGYLVRPSTVVTQQYPENRETLKLFERSRTQLSMQHDANGFHKCTACHICETACPNASIRVHDRPKDKASSARAELDYFVWRLDTCTFCNACVMACPFSVLTMEGSFESSVFDRKLLTYNLTQYAGPTSTALLKVEDVEARKKMTEPRTPYSGPGVPMAGSLAGTKKGDSK